MALEQPRYERKIRRNFESLVERFFPRTRLTYHVLDQFANDVTYHDMTFLYPLGIIRGDNNSVITQRGELPAPRTSQGDGYRPDLPCFLDASDNVLRAAGRTDADGNIVLLQCRLDLT